jgi:hypothetical protein
VRAALPKLSPAREPVEPVLRAVLALGEGQATVLRHEQRAWASITFTGARHSLVLRFVGAEAIAAGDRLAAALPEHEFTLPRQLVADAAVLRAVRHVASDPPILVVELELLILEDR